MLRTSPDPLAQRALLKLRLHLVRSAGAEPGLRRECGVPQCPDGGVQRAGLLCRAVDLAHGPFQDASALLEYELDVDARADLDDGVVVPRAVRFGPAFHPVGPAAGAAGACGRSP